MQKIETFTKKETRFLSNFFPYSFYIYGKGKKYPLKDFKVFYEGLEFDSVECAYHAAKTLDIEIRKKLQKMNPFEALAVSRNGFLDVRPDWEEIKLQVMYDLVWQKFQHYKLKRFLLATGDAILIEGNSWGDTFWGICNGVGENHLGKILMDVRTKLRQQANK